MRRKCPKYKAKVNSKKLAETCGNGCHPFCNQDVIGSNPVAGTTWINRLRTSRGFVDLTYFSIFEFDPVAVSIAANSRHASNGLFRYATQPQFMAFMRVMSLSDPVMNMMGNLKPAAES